MHERYFLVVLCQKYGSIRPIKMSGPPSLGKNSLNIIRPDSPCILHNAERDKVEGKTRFIPHTSRSVIVAVEEDPLSKKDEIKKAALAEAKNVFYGINNNRAAVREKARKRVASKRKKG